MKEYFEIDVTNESKEHLLHIYTMISSPNSKWKECIDELEMRVYQYMIYDEEFEDRIIVNGFAEKKIIKQFIRKVIEDKSLDFLFGKRNI